ncbi:hypothetical protein APHAL10511_005418 [Amanita phalloides]|nr:hypothetical protein APHAL10511_005418 [Amanita phalloides]
MSSTASKTSSPLDYIDIPPAAMLLKSTTPHHRSLQPAPKIMTSLPTPSPAPSQTPRQRSASLIASPSISALPQMLLSSALPGGVTVPGQAPASPTFTSTSGSPTGAGASNLRKKISAEPVQLLSTKDSLSLPIMSVNFRRFVSCVGPVFWLQDRIEEIVMWKKGWTVTGAWLMAYGLFCYFPHLLLCLPHIALIAIILATYPYPTNNAKNSGVVSSVIPDQPPPPEGSIPWQANIQGIQNLMGTFSDLVDFVKPYIYHLRLTPAHLSADISSNAHPTSTGTPATPTFNLPTTPTSTTTTEPSSPMTASPRSSTITSPKLRSSPYTPHILILLLVTLPPLIYIVSLPAFPLRVVIFLAGALPIMCLHPWAIDVLLPTAVVVVHHIWNSPLPERVVDAIQRAKKAHKKWFESRFGRKPIEMVFSEGGDESEDTLIVGKSKSASLKMVVERVVDDERLSDACWQSDMREVELWENERYVGTFSESMLGSPSLGSDMSASRSSLASLTSFGSMGNLSGSPQRARTTSRGPKGSWSKGHLRPSERGPWTRRRDGWSGGDYGRGQENGVEVEGQVNSLTFPLAPGWAFVDTEDWRKDVVAEWAVDECGGGDEDGWVYTNDAWLDPQRSPFGRVLDDIGESEVAVSGAGPCVTRRRRWLRRVWYDPGSVPRY